MKKSKKYKVPKIAAFAFILFLLAVSNQANLRKSLAVKVFSYGNYYFNGGAYDLGKAEGRYKLALFFDSNLSLVHYQLGRIYFVENKSKEALKEIDAELALHPGNQRSYYIRGLIDGYSADFQTAIDDFAKFNAWAPNEWAGYNDLAWAYYKNGNYDQAKETTETGLKLFPDNVWLLNGLGAAELSLSDFSESQKTMEKVSALADNLDVKNWARAYPGNNPADAQYNLDVFKENVGSNLALAENKIPFGGNFAAACASGVCAGTHYNCASGTLGYTAEYADQWQWWCMGQGHPGDTDQLCVEMKAAPESCGACGSCADSRYKWCTGGQYGSGQCLKFAECDNSVDGACAATHYNCTSSAASTDNNDGASAWTWTCPGSNGGNPTSCSENKPVPVDGACPDTNNPANRYTCAAGNLGDTAVYDWGWQWWCNGRNGGSNMLCTEWKIPTASCSVSPNPTPYGGNPGITLSSTNAYYCYVRHDWNPITEGYFGSGTFYPGAQITPGTHQAEVYCYNSVWQGSGWSTCDYTVDLATLPTASCSVSPNPTPYGGNPGITLSSTNGYYCYVRHDWNPITEGYFTSGTFYPGAQTTSGTHEGEVYCYNSVWQGSGWSACPYIVGSACTPSYSSYLCNNPDPSCDGQPCNSIQTGTADCSAIDICSNTRVARPLSECGSCSPKSKNCPACASNSTFWKEVAP